VRERERERERERGGERDTESESERERERGRAKERERERARPGERDRASARETEREREGTEAGERREAAQKRAFSTSIFGNPLREVRNLMSSIIHFFKVCHLCIYLFRVWGVGFRMRDFGFGRSGREGSRPRFGPLRFFARSPKSAPLDCFITQSKVVAQ